MTPDPTRDDISFLKRVSEEGRYAPLLGGRYLLMWGTVITIAYTFQYLILSQTLAWPGWSIAAMWLIVMAIAGGFMATFPKAIRNKPGLHAVSNQVERWVWTAGGMSIFAFASGTILAISLTGASVVLFDMIVAIALAGYGTAFLVVSYIAGQGWMRLPAIGSFIGTGIIPFFAGTPLTYLVGAVIVFFVAVIPGIILLRAEPAALKEAM
ncbi:hypothetical protein [Parvularcula marina]|uniref:Uncharacterized protein n=1 Tax=Parvularcula marina TaxID=2292771 RepID=A0A371RIL6_9PROT|nr:hypothetical protein [Parvularcula marina]RFB05307.1 hypothetical protein DX908_08595 [Parvularcula marina]